jgi:hypothetical protein
LNSDLTRFEIGQNRSLVLISFPKNDAGFVAKAVCDTASGHAQEERHFAGTLCRIDSDGSPDQLRYWKTTLSQTVGAPLLFLFVLYILQQGYNSRVNNGNPHPLSYPLSAITKCQVQSSL